MHCLAHSLNLCLQDAVRVFLAIRKTLHLVMKLVQLIKWSPKRSSLFERVKDEMSPETHDLRTLCPTRWTVRSGAIHAVITNYVIVHKALWPSATTRKNQKPENVILKQRGDQQLSGVCLYAVVTSVPSGG